MKRWAVLTVLLYAFALLAVTLPLWIVCFGWSKSGWRNPPAEVLQVISAWGLWTWLAVAALGQVLLLAVPVEVAEGRPHARRRLKVPVITSAFLFALMTVSLVASVVAALWGDHGFEMFLVLSDEDVLIGLVAYVLVSWVIWVLIFHRSLRETDPETRIRRLTHWLLRGSILELLVAVPSHVIVRQRDDCCAQGLTFWGLSTGLTVMLMSFGPGVFFLFAARMRRLRPKSYLSA